MNTLIGLHHLLCVTLVGVACGQVPKNSSFSGYFQPLPSGSCNQEPACSVTRQSSAHGLPGKGKHKNIILKVTECLDGPSTVRGAVLVLEKYNKSLPLTVYINGQLISPEINVTLLPVHRSRFINGQYCCRRSQCEEQGCIASTATNECREEDYKEAWYQVMYSHANVTELRFRFEVLNTPGGGLDSSDAWCTRVRQIYVIGTPENIRQKSWHLTEAEESVIESTTTAELSCTQQTYPINLNISVRRQDFVQISVEYNTPQEPDIPADCIEIEITLNVTVYRTLESSTDVTSSTMPLCITQFKPTLTAVVSPAFSDGMTHSLPQSSHTDSVRVRLESVTIKFPDTADLELQGVLLQIYRETPMKPAPTPDDQPTTVAVKLSSSTPPHHPGTTASRRTTSKTTTSSTSRPSTVTSVIPASTPSPPVSATSVTSRVTDGEMGSTKRSTRTSVSIQSTGVKPVSTGVSSVTERTSVLAESTSSRLASTGRPVALTTGGQPSSVVTSSTTSTTTASTKSSANDVSTVTWQQSFSSVSEGILLRYRLEFPITNREFAASLGDRSSSDFQNLEGQLLPLLNISLVAVLGARFKGWDQGLNFTNGSIVTETIFNVGDGKLNDDTIKKKKVPTATLR